MSEGAWSLLGVLVGFGLAELMHWAKIKRRERSLRTALMAELEAIVRMLPKKLNVLRQVEEALGQSKIMNASTTHFPGMAYRQMLQDAPDVLSIAERDCLHVLYERLRITDEMMDAVESRFHNISDIHSVDVAAQAAAGSVRDLMAGIEHSKSLALSLLNKNPINVYEGGSDT